jgi:hypothetical protein
MAQYRVSELRTAQPGARESPVSVQQRYIGAEGATPRKLSGTKDRALAKDIWREVLPDLSGVL